jgi:putative Mg2+ transporter-C (MgtC) family protein
MLPFHWGAQALEVAKLLIAYLLVLPVGWVREKEAHFIGVRTFPLVAMASCCYVMLGAPEFVHSADAESRIIQGLVTGIGFIGGAAIFRSEHGVVTGAATAASIWATGAVGAAVAQERWLLAIALSALNLFVIRVLKPLKTKLDNGGSDDTPKL